MKTALVKDRVLQAVIAAEVSKGHLKWKVSDIARFTKVTRPLIYYHFGKTKKDILSECLNVIAEDYYGLSEERSQSLTPTALLESLLRTRNMFLRNPSLVVFYQRSRMQDSQPGRQFIAIERRFQEKLKRSYPRLTDLQISAVHGLFHGVITAPFLNPASLECALALIDFHCADARK